MTSSKTTVAQLVESARRGDEQALSALMPLVYEELRRLAASYMRRERPGQTLQATALVHDAYLRLMRDSKLSWQNWSNGRGPGGPSSVAAAAFV